MSRKPSKAPRGSRPPAEIDVPNPAIETGHAPAGAWWFAGVLITGLLLVLHGSVLGWPFISDDFVFLAASRNISQLFSSFDVYSNYFRPVGRELYFFAGHLLAGDHPLPWHVFDFVLLLAVVALVARLGHRLGGARAGLLAGAVYALLYSHRMIVAWVSCSQDLLAAFFALLAAHALLSQQRWRAGLWHLVAMLSKESVATWPLVYALWRGLELPAGAPWRKRVAHGARASAPLWAATAAWAVIVLGARTLRHAWAKGEGTPLADITLSASSLWEGMRSALLSYAALEQPWSAIGRALTDPHQPWGTLVAALAGVLLLTMLGSRLPGRPRQGADPMLALGALWAVFGALPIALAGHHWSAYYITFSGIGFALFLGRLLSGAPAAMVFATLALSTTLGLAANRVDLFNFARMEPVAGVSYITATRLDFERLFLDSLQVALERVTPPRGAAVYLSYAPRYTTFVTMYGRAPRVWFDDPHLDLKMIGEYRPPESRPHAFLRFDSARRGFMQVPNPLMEAQLAAEAAMDGRRPAEARAQLERALALLPPSGLEAVHLDLLNNRGFACAALSDSAAARDSWRRALALDPSFESAALNWARFDAEAGRLGSARETLERLLLVAPAASDALSLLARVQRAQGDLAAAARTLTRLTAVDPAMAAALGGPATTPTAGSTGPP